MASANGQPDYTFKTVLIGDSSVGKSNIALRFAKNEFHPDSLSTVGVEFIVKEVPIDSKRVSVQVWDTAGQDRFRALTATYFRNAVGALAVYDITSRASFEHLEAWLDELHCYIASDDICVLIVGNKSDLEASRAVTKEEALSFCEKHGLGLIETSAKSAVNVELAFETLLKEVLRQRLKKSLASSTDVPPDKLPFSVEVEHFHPPSPKREDLRPHPPCWC